MNIHRIPRRTAALLFLCYLITVFFSLFVAVHVLEHEEGHEDCSICAAIHSVTTRIQTALKPTTGMLQLSSLLLIFGLGILFIMRSICASTLVSEGVRLDR